MLVGFCILNGGRTPDHSRFFPETVKVIQKSIGGSIIYLYGYGPTYEMPLEEGVYSLYDGDLDRRNFYVTVFANHVEFQSDWLGSFPCYYDETSMEVASHWGMLDLDSREMDPVGSYTLKRYSFIPTSRTLKVGVNRLLACQTLVWRSRQIECRLGDLTIKKEAPVQTDEIVDRIVARLVQDDVRENEVIVPLSGGYDSRFLASIVKNRIGCCFKSFTYSLLGPRGDCFESKVSKVVAQKLNSPWRSFDLTGYARYEQSIIDWSGGFSHVNGDYYEMFAQQVLNKMSASSLGSHPLIISGIVGDLWCGKIMIQYHPDIQGKNVLLSHGISTYEWLTNADEHGVSKHAEEELNAFFRERVHSDETILLELVRAKVPLLSFLCYSFERRGVRCAAPFLDKSVVQSVLSLEPEEKRHRKWQTAYFNKHGLSDDHLPKVLLKVNRLAVDEGVNKRFDAYDSLRLSAWKLWLLRLMLSRPFRRIERAFTRHKVTEYLLRKSGYKRSDVLISILNVVTR